jgi:hypothetical protein
MSLEDFVNEVNSTETEEGKEFKKFELVLELTKPKNEVYKVLFAASN